MANAPKNPIPDLWMLAFTIFAFFVALASILQT